MDFTSVVSFFNSYGAQLPFVLKEDGEKFFLILNPNNAYNTIVLNDGVYYELLTGAWSSTSSQVLTLRLRNPNVVRLEDSYYVVLYDKNTRSAVAQQQIPYDCEGLEVSFITNVQNPYITIETSTQVLFSTDDFLSGRIPLNQNFYASFKDQNNTEIFRTFGFRKIDNKKYFFDAYRSVYSAFSSNNQLSFRFLDAYLNESSIANLSYSVTTEFKFPEQYKFVEESKTYFVSSYSVLLLSFFKELVEKISEQSINDININSLELNYHNLLYESYTYDKTLLSYRKLSDKSNIVDLLLASLLGIKFYKLLEQSSVYIDNIISLLRSFTPIIYYPEPGTSTFLLPDFINNQTEEEYSLATNLLFAHILKLLRIDNSQLLSEIERVFVSRNRKKISRTNGEIDTFFPLEAALIYKFSPIYLDLNNSYVSNLVSSAENYLYQSVNYINSLTINTDINSDFYNPIFDKTFGVMLPFYESKTYLNLFVNVFLNESINAFLEFSNEGAILDSYKFSYLNDEYILPSLRSNLTYFFLSIDNINDIEEPRKESEEVFIIDKQIFNSNNFLYANITLNKPAKILGLVLDNSNNPIAFVSSMNESFVHSLTFNVPYFSSNHTLKIFILK